MALVAVALVLGAVFYGPPRPSSVRGSPNTRPSTRWTRSTPPYNASSYGTLTSQTGHHDPLLDVSFIDPKSIIASGLADAHAHILSYGSSKLNVDLSGCASKQEVLERLVDFVKARLGILNDRSKWIQGMGWDHNIWAVPEYPHADDFDAEPLLRGRRIYLDRIDFHVAWVSRRVLQLMGEFPNILDGGQIVCDSSANPTGIFVDKAKSLIPVLPPSKADMLRYFDRTVKDALAVGLTSIHDASAEPDAVEFYKYLAHPSKIRRGQETPGICLMSVYPFILRIHAVASPLSHDYPAWLTTALADASTFAVPSFSSTAIGALGSFGATLMEPYSDNPTTTGIMRIQEDVLSDLVRRFHANGWQVDKRHVVCGTAFGSGTYSRRICIFKRLDTKSPLLAQIFPWRVLTQYGAFTLQSLGSRSLDDLRMALKGGALLALKGMTLDAAYASFSASVTRSLTMGKKADFVVLDRDIMTVPESEVLELRY
ncbi:amidohydrolase family-domain-containing protein [Pisolithus microcarpus]|nr:amidohydrolase family-domain-containing protein [Pisolithus microcarpus]